MGTGCSGSSSRIPEEQELRGRQRAGPWRPPRVPKGQQPPAVRRRGRASRPPTSSRELHDQVPDRKGGAARPGPRQKRAQEEEGADTGTSPEWQLLARLQTQAR